MPSRQAPTWQAASRSEFVFFAVCRNVTFLLVAVDQITQPWGKKAQMQWSDGSAVGRSVPAVFIENC